MRNLRNVLTSKEEELSIKEQKKILRQRLIQERLELFQKSNSRNWGARHFLRSLELLKHDPKSFEKAQEEKKFVVACYFPIRGELNIADFAQENWLFPKISNGNLLWFKYGDGKTGYLKNKFGILEKNDSECIEYSLDLPPMLCYIPGLAASKEGYRLGYGGGFYDRFIEKYSDNITTIFCIPSKQFLFNSIPIEEHDKKIDLIVW